MIEQPQNSEKLERLSRMKQANGIGMSSLETSRQAKTPTPLEIISKAIQKRYQVKQEESEIIARQVVLAPRETSLSVGGEEIKVEEMQYQIATDISEDLSYILADSYEQINSESTSSREYYRWLEETEGIIKHMNDGFVSHDDLKERNDFLEMSNQREMEMMVCISLYQGSAFKGAPEKYNEMYYKLTKLRQMRSMIKQTTKNEEDRQVEKEEYLKALEYYHVVKELKEHDLYWELPVEKQKNIGQAAYEAGTNRGYDDNGYGVYHGDDKDLSPNYVWYDWLRAEMVKSMSPSQYNNQYDHSMGEMFMLKRMGNENQDTRESLAAHIERLSGRRPPLKNVAEYNYSEVRKRAFDITRFNTLDGREM